MKKLLLPLLIAAALAGCSAFPENYEKPVMGTDITAQMQDQWSSTPAVSKVKSRAGVSVRKFNDVPPDLRSRAVRLSLEPGAVLSVADLVSALRAQGFRVASSLKETAGAELVAGFDGDLGSLLDLLAAEHNVAYEYRNDVLFLAESGRYVVSLPQHAEFLTQVATGLTDMGATGVRADVRAGRVYYSAKPDVAQYLEEYIAVLGKNSAMVQLQVAVITVRLTRDLNLGLDWSKMQIGGGRKDLAPGKLSFADALGSGKTSTGTGGATGTGSKGSTGTTGTTGAAGTVADAAAAAAVDAIKLGTVMAFTGGDGLAYKFVNDTFSLTAAINALSTYGNARTEQNVIMGTLSGLPVKIGSGNEIPYVKKIGSTTASGGATAGSSETDIVKSGLKLEITPNFEADDLSVVTTMKVDMSSLVGFRELSAGANLGTMSQPEMQKLEFENVGRLQVGETLVVGGITYDQINNSYSNLPGLETVPTGSKAEKTSRYAVYIVIRPTATIFETAPEVKASVPAPQVVAQPIRHQAPMATPYMPDALRDVVPADKVGAAPRQVLKAAPTARPELAKQVRSLPADAVLFQKGKPSAAALLQAQAEAQAAEAQVSELRAAAAKAGDPAKVVQARVAAEAAGAKAIEARQRASELAQELRARHDAHAAPAPRTPASEPADSTQGAR